MIDMDKIVAPDMMSLLELQGFVLNMVKEDLELVKDISKICNKSIIAITVKYAIKRPTLQNVVDNLRERIESIKIGFTEDDRIEYLNVISDANRFHYKSWNTMDYKEKNMAMKTGNIEKWEGLNSDEQMCESILHKNKLCRCFRF